MTKAKPFHRLAAPAKADPDRQARITAHKRAIRDTLGLVALRESQQLTQRDIAMTLGVSQLNVSRIEHQEDVYLSTLREYIAALGGQMTVSAVFPDRTITPVPDVKDEQDS